MKYYWLNFDFEENVAKLKEFKARNYYYNIYTDKKIFKTSFNHIKWFGTETKKVELKSGDYTKLSTEKLKKQYFQKFLTEWWLIKNVDTSKNPFCTELNRIDNDSISE